MSFKRVALGILCALLVAAPAAADTYNATVFTASPVSVKLGQEFLIALPSNPTTGYTWKARASNNVVTVYGSAYQAPTRRAMGAGGEQIFVSAANRPGTSQVVFAYVRPWQKGVKPARTLTFSVTVTR